MSFNWQTVLGTYLICCCWSRLVGAQLFEQPAASRATTTTNVVYTTYLQRGGRSSGGGATQLTSAQRATPIQITKATELQEIKDGDALAPLLQQLLRQTMPNWQQPQQQHQHKQKQQQQQQQQQHFFVYENIEPGRRASQQPQILQEFNGVNSRQQQQQQQRPQSTSIQQKQQQQQQQQHYYTQQPIQKQQQQQQKYQRIQYVQTAPKIALAPPAAAAATSPAATATWPPAVGFAAPIGTSGNTFQPISPHANNATDAWCERCCREEGAATTPCSCCGSKPLLSAALLKATAG